MITVRRLLVLHAGALGDCVLAIQLARMMRRTWGKPDITIAARSPIALWAARHGFVDQAVGLERVGGHRLYGADLPLPREASEFLGRFDRVVSLLGGPDAPISRRLAILVDAEVIAVDAAPDERAGGAGVHITKQWVREIERQGFPVPWSDDLPETAGSPGGLTVSHRRRGPASGALLIHPGSGGLEKVCPLEAMETLATEAEHSGWRVRWLIGPDEMERFGEAYADRLRTVAPVVFEPSVEMAADLVAGTDAYVGNDAGMTHVAALVGVPTIALFGPTDPRVWRPLGPACHVESFPARVDSFEDWSRRTLTRIEAGPQASP